jgi:hypothetical protein
METQRITMTRNDSKALFLEWSSHDLGAAMYIKSHLEHPGTSISFNESGTLCYALDYANYHGSPQCPIPHTCREIIKDAILKQCFSTEEQIFIKLSGSHIDFSIYSVDI